MEKPNNIVFKLSELGWIHGIHIEQKQTGTDTAATFCKITGSNGKCEGKWSTYEKYLNVSVGHTYIARIKHEYVDAMAAWKAFEEENSIELAEYERLKAKFDSGVTGIRQRD